MKGKPDHGYWDEDTEKDRCILRCYGGYEPSGCHVIRYNYWKEKWNHDVPKCQEGKGMSKLYICKYILTPTPRSLGVPKQQLDNIQHGQSGVILLTKIDTKVQKSNSLTDITYSTSVGF